MTMLAIVFGILLAEVALQLATLASPQIATLLAQAEGPVLPDEVLGRRGNPRWIDHDARGYRNPQALAAAEIVALGDSHTYGSGVHSDQAWPSVLGKTIGMSTYNMGFGGYGPTNSLMQLDEALGLAPRLVIEAVYFGNDFADDFMVAMRSKRIGSWLDPEEFSELERLEKVEKLEDRATELFRGRKPRRQKEPGVLGNALAEHSALYSLGKVVRIRLSGKRQRGGAVLGDDFDAAVRALKPRARQFSSVFEGGGWQAILTAPYRDLVMDISDARVRAGYGITQRALLEIKRRLDAECVQMLVVLLPTKEFVFASRVTDMGSQKGLAKLVADEQERRADLSRFLQENGIQYVDPFPALAASVSQTYFRSANGHPNALGQEIIAREVLEAARTVLALPGPGSCSTASGLSTKPPTR